MTKNYFTCGCKQSKVRIASRTWHVPKLIYLHDMESCPAKFIISDIMLNMLYETKCYSTMHLHKFVIGQQIWHVSD